jgi:hypothetical protein
MSESNPFWSVKHPATTVAAMNGYTPEWIRIYRYKHPELAALGETIGREVYFDIGEASLFAILAAMIRRKSTVEGNVPGALGLLPVVMQIAKGELGGPGRDVFAVEVTLLGGEVRRLVADGPDELAAATAAMAREGATGMAVLNLSDIVGGVIMGWLIATVGEAAAREVFLDMVGTYPPEVQPVLAKEFRDLAERMAERKRVRAPSPESDLAAHEAAAALARVMRPAGHAY